MNAPANITEAVAINREWLLAAMKAARCRIRKLEYEVEEVSAALRAGMITTEGAIAWLDQLDGLGWIPHGSEHDQRQR
jgi:hypothetical protein